MSTFTGSSGGDNPYQSPPASQPTAVPETRPTVSQRTLDMLQQTKPWVRFMSVLGFICAGFMLLGTFAIGLGAASDRFGPMSGFIAAIYAFMAILYLAGSIHLFRYASRIAILQYTRDVESLESALEAQKSFWKLLGAVVAVVLLLYAAVIVVAIMIGLSR